jgi:hypothetical protein
MNIRAAAVGAFSLVLFLSANATATAIWPQKSHEDEAKLLSKLERENNPVKKAKLETKLGRLKLENAFKSYDRGQFDQCWKLLDEYMTRMNNAWADLVASGNQAARKPDGFKQLEIALRESRRDLQDFEVRITYEERQTAEKIRARTVELRARVLNALFPGAAPKRKKGSSAGSKPPASEPNKGPQ